MKREEEKTDVDVSFSTTDCQSSHMVSLSAIVIIRRRGRSRPIYLRMYFQPLAVDGDMLPLGSLTHLTY